MAESLVRTVEPDRSVLRRAMSGVTSDSLSRNSTFLVINSVLVAGLGFLFWTIAARFFSAGEIGTTTTVISALTYAGMVGTLGLPNTVIAFLAHASDPVRLLVTFGAVSASVSALVGLLWCVMPGQLGIPLSTVAPGWTTIPVVSAAVALGSVGAIAQAAIIALRKCEWVVVENAAGSLFKLAALPLVIGLGSAGLFDLFVGSLLVSGLASIVIVVHVVGGQRRAWLRGIDFGAVVRVRSFAAGNHAAALASMLPGQVIRIVVLSQLGARQAAFLAMPLMIIALLKIIPSIAAQSLFAEAAADAASLGRHARRTLRGIYLVLVPAAIGLVVLARPILSIFGPDYADEGTRCLQFLALSGIFAGASYVADTILNAQRRVRAYVFVNVVGSACAMFFPLALVSHGLAGVGFGWLLGQIAYCVIATSAVVSSPGTGMGWARPDTPPRES